MRCNDLRKNKATGIVSASELDFISQFVIIKYVEPEFGGWGGGTETGRTREECKNALTWQSTIK